MWGYLVLGYHLSVERGGEKKNSISLTWLTLKDYQFQWLQGHCILLTKIRSGLRIAFYKVFFFKKISTLLLAPMRAMPQQLAVYMPGHRLTSINVDLACSSAASSNHCTLHTMYGSSGSTCGCSLWLHGPYQGACQSDPFTNKWKEICQTTRQNGPAHITFSLVIVDYTSRVYHKISSGRWCFSGYLPQGATLPKSFSAVND
jgi:hypothetical protein